MRGLPVLVLGGVALAGCATADMPEVTSAGQRIRVGKSDPVGGMQEIGPIEATNGSGCGSFGARGTYEGANVELKNQAADMGADYVQIFTITEPHQTGGCFSNKFVIRGIAFRGLYQARGFGPVAAPRPPINTAPAPAVPVMAPTAALLATDQPSSPAWPPLPADYVSGRPATPDDVLAGRAVFAGQINGTALPRPLPVVVPQYAYCVVNGAPLPGIIVQAEEAYGMEVAGFRPVAAGGKPVVAELGKCRLLGQTPPHR